MLSILQQSVAVYEQFNNNWKTPGQLEKLTLETNIHPEANDSSSFYPSSII